MVKYTDITQNTYVQSWTVTEIIYIILYIYRVFQGVYIWVCVCVCVWIPDIHRTVTRSARSTLIEILSPELLISSRHGNYMYHMRQTLQILSPELLISSRHGNYMYHMRHTLQILSPELLISSKHGNYMYHMRHTLFTTQTLGICYPRSQSALRGWSLSRRRNVFPVRYGLARLSKCHCSFRAHSAAYKILICTSWRCASALAQLSSTSMTVALDATAHVNKAVSLLVCSGIRGMRYSNILPPSTHGK
jgi:hypothetical protein